MSFTLKNSEVLGSPGGSVVLVLPSAQGVILETQDPVPHWAPCMEFASPSACVSASLSVSLTNKQNLQKNKIKEKAVHFRFLPDHF